LPKPNKSLEELLSQLQLLQILLDCSHSKGKRIINKFINS